MYEIERLFKVRNEQLELNKLLTITWGEEEEGGGRWKNEKEWTLVCVKWRDLQIVISDSGMTYIDMLY